MKTKTVRVDELEGEALEWAGKNLTPLFGKHSSKTIRQALNVLRGPTVEVPAELVEVSDV